MTLTNKEGEKLYLYVRTSSQEFSHPHIVIATWEECLQMFNEAVVDVDNDSWLKKVISKKIELEYQRAHAQLLKNHKGWGYDYYEEITISVAWSM